MTAVSGALAGRRIVITRAEAQASELVERLRALGAEVIACPAIRILPPEDWGPLDAALRELPAFDWVVFTSANAVRSVVERLTLAGGGSVALQVVRVASVGDATGRALQACGVSADLTPGRFTAAALAESMGDLRDLRILLPRSDIAPPMLPAALLAAGAMVHEVTAYRTVPTDDISRLLGGESDGRTGKPVDVIAFTSPSTARSFFNGLRAANALENLLGGERHPALICIGTTTADAVREIAGGLAVAAVAQTHDNEGLVDAIVRWGGTAGKREEGRGKR